MRAGSIKPYAVTADARLASAPEMPTFCRDGTARAFAFGLVRAPRAEEYAEGRHEQAQCSGRGSIGMDVFPCERQTPEALEAFVKAGVEKWWTNPYTLTDYTRDQLSALGHRRAAIGLGKYLSLEKRIAHSGPDAAPLQVQVARSH
jgi:hypothetical protein